MDELQRSRFTGFSDTYDKYRPASPVAELHTILRRYLPSPLQTLVDVGCGTGLSTLPWARTAKQVIGIEPNVDMISTATRNAEVTGVRNVRFVNAEAAEIPLDDGSADLITCSQSFHWMEPTTTLSELARVLRSGGVLAIYDCDWPPTIGEELEKSFERIRRECKATLGERGRDAKQWPKSEHLENIRRSGFFRFQKETAFHTVVETDAERYIGLIESQGVVQEAHKLDNEVLEGLVRTEEARIRDEIGQATVEMVLTYRLLIGIRT
jgi:ubiquinone/menaquinone biosynthesis C-methylase UbiE